MAKIASGRRVRVTFRGTTNPTRRALLAKTLVEANKKRGIKSDPALIALAAQAPASGRASS